MGVVSAAVKFAGADWYIASWADSAGAEILSIVMYVALFTYFVVAAKRVKNK